MVHKSVAQLFMHLKLRVAMKVAKPKWGNVSKGQKVHYLFASGYWLFAGILNASFYLKLVGIYYE